MNMTDKQANADITAYQFLAGSIDIKKGEAGNKRTFSAIAYHGGLIPNHWYWGDLVFDLDGLTFNDGKVPMLMQHDADKRCGYATSHSTGTDGLTADGVLLSNEYGASVSNDADEGYPWQMSVGIEPATVELIESGTATVNNQTFNAPITVFRRNTIREISFCALGADSKTSAQVFTKTHTILSEEDNVDIKELQSQVESLQTQLKDATDAVAAKDAELLAFKQAKRTDDIAALSERTGVTFSDEQIAKFAAMTDDVFIFAASMIPSKVEATGNQLPAQMFSEQALDGVNAVKIEDAKFNEWAKTNA